MSQAGILDLTGGAGGNGILTISGNDLVAVGPDGAQNINLIGINGTIVEASLTPFTLEIDAFGQQYFLQTLDATETPFPAFATEFDLIANSAITVEASIAGARDDYSASCWGSLTFGARRAAGGAVAVGVAVPNQSTDGVGVVIGARVVGNSIEVTVIGEAGTEWNWTATIRTIFQ
jgi:hypothetical protein